MSRDDEVIDWLLEGDPAVRWQTMRDLTDASPDAVAAERARVAHEGWCPGWLARQRADGTWGGGGDAGPTWRFNLDILEIIRLLGPDPSDPEVRRRIELTRDLVHWPDEFGAPPYFEGEVEACINGEVLSQGAFFGEPSGSLAERLVSEQLEDGGWNCEAPQSSRGSFNSTIRVLEGLLGYERAVGGWKPAATARARAEEYLLERGLLRRRSTGEIVDEAFLRFAWPGRWLYDVLRGLDYLRDAGRAADPRLTEALDIVRSRRRPDGRWVAESAPPEEGIEEVEPSGEPSRMVTLRALRVLRHFDVA